MSLNNPIKDWKNRRVWIIGASSGIGASLATQLQSLGAKIALSARRSEKLEKIATRNDLVLPLDVTDSTAVHAARQQIESHWQGIDLIIYCAGVYSPMRAWNIDLELTKRMLDINLNGVYNCLQAIIPGFLDNEKGGICLVASIAGVTGLPKALGYGPTKAAMINMAEVLYTDLAPKGIDVYLVNPGFVDTRLTQKNDFTMPAMITPEEAATAIVEGISKGRFEIHFPKRFTYFVKILGMLPDKLRFHFLKRMATP